VHGQGGTRAVAVAWVRAGLLCAQRIWMDATSAEPGARQPQSSLGRFLRLWFVLGFAYFSAKLLFNLAVMGWIWVIRLDALLEIIFVPLGQSVVFWMVTRRARRRAAMV